MGQCGALKINFIKYILNGERIKLGGWHVKAEERVMLEQENVRKAEMRPMFQEENLASPRFMGIFLLDSMEPTFPPFSWWSRES